LARFATSSRGVGAVHAKKSTLDNDDEPKLIPNAEKVYKWVNGR
jgi:hypothetical protein